MSNAKSQEITALAKSLAEERGIYTTVDELSAMWEIQRSLAEDKEHLERIRAEAYSAPAVNLSGMPHGSSDLGSRLELYALQIAGLEDSILEKELAILQEEKKLRLYMNSIPDSQIRWLMNLRFVRCLSWNQISDVEQREAARDYDNGIVNVRNEEGQRISKRRYVAWVAVMPDSAKKILYRFIRTQWKEFLAEAGRILEGKP